MKYAIDETELARLEESAGKASKGPFFEDGFDVQDDDDNEVACCNRSDDLSEDVQEANTHYIAAACNAVPALVAEVRGLREKVEAWEWFEECYEVMRLLVQIGPNRADAHEEAVISAFDALNRAVHADRE